MSDDQEFYLSCFFCCEWRVWGFVVCLFLIYWISSTLSTRERKGILCLGLSGVVGFFFCVFLLCGWVQTRIERIYSKTQDFLFVLAGLFSFCLCSLCSICFGNDSTVYYKEEQGCASSTQLMNEARLTFADVHMGQVQKQGLWLWWEADVHLLKEREMEEGKL